MGGSAVLPMQKHLALVPSINNIMVMLKNFGTSFDSISHLMHCWIVFGTTKATPIAAIVAPSVGRASNEFVQSWQLTLSWIGTHFYNFVSVSLMCFSQKPTPTRKFKARACLRHFQMVSYSCFSRKFVKSMKNKRSIWFLCALLGWKCVIHSIFRVVSRAHCIFMLVDLTPNCGEGKLCDVAKNFIWIFRKLLCRSFNRTRNAVSGVNSSLFRWVDR